MCIAGIILPYILIGERFWSTIATSSTACECARARARVAHGASERTVRARWIEHRRHSTSTPTGLISPTPDVFISSGLDTFTFVYPSWFPRARPRLVVSGSLADPARGHASFVRNVPHGARVF